MLSQKLITELGIIIKEEYNQELQPQDLLLVADILVKYFTDLMEWQEELNKKNEQKDSPLLKAEIQQKFTQKFKIDNV